MPVAHLIDEGAEAGDAEMVVRLFEVDGSRYLGMHCCAA